MMMMGQEVRLPAEIVFGNRTCESGDITCYGDIVNQLRVRMQQAHDVASEHLRHNARRRKDHYDLDLQAVNFNPGDMVWFLNEERKVGVSYKLQPTYLGPCLIVKKVTDVDYGVLMDEKKKPRVLHHDKLKPYEGVL